MCQCLARLRERPCPEGAHPLLAAILFLRAWAAGTETDPGVHPSLSAPRARAQLPPSLGAPDTILPPGHPTPWLLSQHLPQL